MEPRLEYSRDELLADHPYARRLEFLGHRFHGGFTAAGVYRSPRTLFRIPAVEAWAGRLAAAGGPTVLVAHDIVPAFFPSVEQSRLLLKSGVAEPIVRILTVIAIVEGFGNTGLQAIPKPPLEPLIKESIRATALAHFYKGLIEAHGRDEAGWGEEGGHNMMWEVARDLALGNPPVPPDIMQSVMIGRGHQPPRMHPEIAEPLEQMLTALINLLAIEVFAESSFEWAKKLLADPEVSARAEVAGEIVGYIQQDEKVHVAYLTVGMLELRARTLIGEGGREIAAQPIIDEITARVKAAHLGTRGRTIRAQRYEQIKQALSRHPSGDRLLEEFNRIGPTPPPA